jgi:hypothetical protein
VAGIHPVAFISNFFVNMVMILIRDGRYKKMEILQMSSRQQLLTGAMAMRLQTRDGFSTLG